MVLFLSVNIVPVFLLFTTEMLRESIDLVLDQNGVMFGKGFIGLILSTSTLGCLMSFSRLKDHSLHFPMSTFLRCRYRHLRMTRGHCESLALQCKELAFPTLYPFYGNPLEQRNP